MADEEKGVDSDLIRGHIDTIILKVLKTGDRYGLEIIEDVAKASGGLYELKQPTLYSCLKRLEGQGLISSYWTDSDIGGKRHYYKLTEEGSSVLAKNQSDWAKSRSIIESLIYEDAPSVAPIKQVSVEAEQNNIESFNKEPEIPTENEEPVVEIDSAADDDDAFGSLDVSDSEAAEIYSEFKDEQQNTDIKIKPFTDENETSNEQEETEDEQENDSQVVEDELLAFNELEKQRKANEPTALELAVEESEDKQEEPIEEPEIEFSTFANENREQTKFNLFDEQEETASFASKQDALDILFGDGSASEVEDEPDDQAKEEEKIDTEVVVEDKTNEITETPVVDKTIELSTIPVDPTYEQKQTLKMFEANTVNASLTDNGFKKRLSELSAYAIHKPEETNQRRGIEYHPEDYDTINDRFKQWGIAVRNHKKIEKQKEEKTHLLTNKIRLARAWITFGVTALLLLVSLAIFAGLKPQFMTFKNALPLYLPFFIVLLLYPIIMSIIYSIDPNKRAQAKYAPRLSIIASVLFFIQAVIIVYAINLQCGLVSLTQKGYNHLGWIVPCIASLAIIIQSITYYFLYKSKKFHN